MGLFSRLFGGNKDSEGEVGTVSGVSAPIPQAQPSSNPVKPDNDKMKQDLEQLKAFENKIRNKTEGLEHEQRERPMQRELTQAEKALRLKNPFRGE